MTRITLIGDLRVATDQLQQLGFAPARVQRVSVTVMASAG